MFVYAVKSSKIKLIALILLVAIAVGAMIYVSSDDTPAAQDGVISLKAGTAEERLAFLSQFGWEVDEDPVEVAEVIVPSEFDEVYENYNAIQKAQNLDMTPYNGKRVKRWTYSVRNYPGYEARKNVVQINMLVYEGMVVGGDVCSLELNGFIQGFDRPTQEAEAGKQATDG
ncbi:MAG: DUF4830 domain-containing protein [Oscillospiraceae bacterium]|nr:DUF4830 domain-containing protein [Oscillospiraceae bacterium]